MKTKSKLLITGAAVFAALAVFSAVYAINNGNMSPIGQWYYNHRITSYLQDKYDKEVSVDNIYQDPEVGVKASFRFCDSESKEYSIYLWDNVFFDNYFNEYLTADLNDYLSHKFTDNSIHIQASADTNYNEDYPRIKSAYKSLENDRDGKTLHYIEHKKRLGKCTTVRAYLDENADNGDIVNNMESLCGSISFLALEIYLPTGNQNANNTEYTIYTLDFATAESIHTPSDLSSCFSNPLVLKRTEYI